MKIIIPSATRDSQLLPKTSSTLIPSFTPEEDKGRIDLIHIDVPDHDRDGVTQGWEKYCWTPWRAYLESL